MSNNATEWFLLSCWFSRIGWKMYYFQEFLIYFNRSYGFMLFILICAYSDGQLPNLSLQVRITFAFYEYTSLKLRIKNKNKITIKENYLKF